MCPAFSTPQDITVGKPAKAQLARPVTGPEEAFKRMSGKQFVVETKFDGKSFNGLQCSYPEWWSMLIDL